MNKTKIHIGCGKRNFGKEWLHVDGDYRFSHVEWIDIINLPINKNTAKIIYASHVLEYFDREEAEKVLRAWFDYLAPGGILRLAVPDFNAMSKLYVEGKIKLSNILGPLYGKMNMGQKTIYHKTVYDYNDLHNLLKTVGFEYIYIYNWRETEHSHIDDHSQAYIPHMDKTNGVLISLNVEAIKNGREE